MKVGTILATLTVVTLGATSLTAVAQTANPPTPRPAAGALPQANTNAVQRSFRTQSDQERQSSTGASAMDVGQSGRVRVAEGSNNPPTPRPAAGALPQTNPNAVQKSFRVQSSQEQQSSTTTSPMDLGQSGRTRQPN